MYYDVLVTDLWFSNTDGAPQGFSALSMCSVLNIVDISLFFSIAANTCLNFVFMVCLFTLVC